jgi:acetamidase/formamidase
VDGVHAELGLLADDFPEPFLKFFDLRGGAAATVAPGVEVPLDPFLGTMGVLCSLAGDLRIHEIVDAGVWNVGMVMPLSVFG